MGGDVATPNPKSPQKRKLANHGTQFNAWGSFAHSSPQLSRSPQRKRPTNVERVSPNNAKALSTSCVELEDGMTLINALGDISIRKTPTRPNASRQGDTGSPIHPMTQSPGGRGGTSAPRKITPALSSTNQPKTVPTHSRRVEPESVGLEIESDTPQSSKDALAAPNLVACDVFLQSDSDVTSVQKSSLDAAAPLSKPLREISPKIRVVGRRIESDSEDDAGPPSFPSRSIGASLQRNGTETSGSVTNGTPAARVTELFSDHEEPLVSATRHSCSPSRNPNVPATRPLHSSAEGTNMLARQITNFDGSFNVADGLLHFSRVPASPSKRPPKHPTTFIHKPGNLPSSEQGILVHSDSDDDEVAQILDDKAPSRRTRNKRVSVWSIKDEMEVLAISSSDTDEDIDDDVSPSIHLRTPLQPHSTKKANPPVPSGSRKPLNKSTTPRNRPPSKKHVREMLARYAEELYTSLNETVFSTKLPPVKTPQNNGLNPCEIVWSNTLKKTAGRAIVKSTISKAPGGVTKFTVSIELAVKVVDSEERIRHTLSHEMCHLAVWVIDQVKENDHGPSFKTWAAKIMRTRKDITITTRHSYEIAYKYEWKCTDCSQTYGRHSKSIRPSEQVCGRCKGQLKPLFEEREVRASGWTLFVKEQMGPTLASNPGITRGEAMKEIGKLWRLRGHLEVTDIDSVVEELSSLSVRT